MARLNIIVVIIGIVLMYTFAQENLYSNKYDDIDIIAIVTNDKLQTEYYKCFMDIEPCITADAKFFKEIFGEILQTQCKKCTEKQKTMLNQLTDWYTKNKPDEWLNLVEKFVGDAKKKNAK